MSKYLDADMLEKDGWSMERTRQVSSTYMLYEKKKPTDFPAADVEEVKHGKWIDAECYSEGCDDGYICSECRRITYRIMTPYCPNCGAKMEVKE